MNYFLIGIAAATLLANSALAGSVALVSFANSVPEATGVDAEVGWQFTLSKSVKVTALGIWDFNNQPLRQAHTLGIFRDSDHTLMGSETIPSGTNGYFTDGFEFLDLSSPFDLAAGSYSIVQTEIAATQDGFRSLADSVTTDGDVTYTQSARTYAAGFGYPTNFGAFADGYFGPNFIFTENAAPTPEPGTSALVAVSAIGLFALRSFLANSRNRRLEQKRAFR